MKRKIFKTCKVCGNDKPIDEFVTHKNYKDGHSNICIECNKLKYQTSFRTQVLDSLKRIEEKLESNAERNN